MSFRSTAARSLSSIRPTLRATPVKSIGRRHAGGGGYNPPTGWLFGEKPPPPGQKRKKEDWERLFHWGMITPFVLLVIFKAYGPDTTMDSWARKEAEKRMTERGDMPVYNPPRDNVISYEEWDRREAAKKAAEGKH